MNSMKYGISLLSGGLDSAVTTAIAKEQCDKVLALSVNYGQTHWVELDHGRQVAEALGIERKVIDLSAVKDLSWYSALTNMPNSLDYDRDPEVMSSSAPPMSYVPMRNSILLSVAFGWAESIGLNLIESKEYHAWEIDPLRIYVGANALDYSGYPDCRPDYYAAMGRALNLGSKLHTTYHVDMRIETPIIDKTKAQIIETGMAKGAPLAYTWSCYEGLQYPCLSCDSCIIRAAAFSSLGIPDPAL